VRSNLVDLYLLNQIITDFFLHQRQNWQVLEVKAKGLKGWQSKTSGCGGEVIGERKQETVDERVELKQSRGVGAAGGRPED
jgi:hypothetical protein